MCNFFKGRWNLFAVFILLFASLNAQTVIYSENFNGASNTFTLNTAEAASTGSGKNFWIVNNAYAGGAGTVTCLGFPFQFTAPNTSTQPVAIAGSPNSNYLHVLSTAAQQSGILNCSFQGADGLCAPAEKIFARTGDLNTTGYSNVSLSFYWLCAGAANIYGEVLYSTDGGANWTVITTPVAQYNNSSNWQQQTITLQAFDNKASIRFGFRFNNNIDAAAADPGFGIDEVVLSGTTGTVSPEITTSFAPDASYCPGAQINIPFTSTGTFSAGNVYKAQLSDASGSFAAPVEIGTLSSTANAGTIPATVPVSTPNGSAYRVRVVSTNPAITGTPNTNDFAVAPAPQIPVSRDPAGATNLCAGPITLSIPGGFSGIQWSPGGQTGNSILVSTPGDYSVTANGSGGCQAQSEVITIAGAEAPVADFEYNQPAGYLVEFTNTSENGTTYFWNFGAATTTSVNPTFTFPFDGDYPVTLIATNECGSDTITIVVNVKKFVGINDLEANSTLNIHPIPAHELLFLDFTSSRIEDARISVMNITGQEVFTEHCRLGGTVSKSIPVNQLSQGIYFIRVSSASGTISSRFTKN
jgi:PKD repeat protein